MKIKLYFILSFIILISLSPLRANNVEKDTVSGRWNIKDYTQGILNAASAGIEFRMKAGVSLGGTLPIPIPLEIQKVKSFKPLLNISLEAEFMKTFTENAGLSFGLRIETKGMETNAQVKNYNMKMVAKDGGAVEGRWTGSVKTKVTLSYLTLPVLAVWNPSPRWDIKIGPYVSYRLYGDFSGSAYDGYLREGSPVGEKVEIEEAMYEFSSDLRRWAWGAQLGASWRAFPHLLIGVDLTWGFNSIFKKSFEVIKFDMYPVFVNVNFGYAF